MNNSRRVQLPSSSASQRFFCRAPLGKEKTFRAPPGKEKTFCPPPLRINCMKIVSCAGAYRTLSVWGEGAQKIRFARISDVKFYKIDTFGPKVGVHFTSDSQCKLIPHFLTKRKIPEFSGKLPEFGGGSAVPPDPRLVRLCLCITLYPYQH